MCFVLIISSASVYAQKQEMDSVIIVENRIQALYGNHNSNIQILNKEQIAALPVKSVNELLTYVAGVDIRQRGPWGTQSDVSIDGSTSDQVLLLIDGVKVSDPQTGHNMLNIPIPIAAIDHIEVLRGPAARIYGVNALAGTINIITNNPKENRVFAQAYVGSSFTKDTSTGATFYNRGIQAAATLASENQSHTISFGQDQSNGYRYNTRMESYRLFYQNKIKLNEKNSIETMGGFVSNAFGASLFYAAPVDPEATEHVQTGIAALGYHWKPNKRWTITPRVSYRYNNDDYIFIRQKPDYYHNVHETNVLSTELNATYQLKNATAAIGAEWRDEHINSNSLGKRQRDNIGFFGEYKHYCSKKLNIGAGIYLNQNSDYGFQAFPAIDAGYRFLPNFKIFTSASTGQRLPTFTDLYYVGPSNIGNPYLKPETATYGELGLQFTQPILEAKAIIFARSSQNFIDWTRNNDTAKWQPQNYQSVTTKGASISLNYKLSRNCNWSDDYELTIAANYTWLNQTINVTADKISKYNIDALRNQLNISIRSLWFKTLQINIATRYLQRISNNDYTVLDVRIGYQIKQWTIYSDLNNLLDTQYKEIGSVPMPGRWFSFGVKFDTVWK